MWRWTMLPVLLALLAGCSDFDFKVNERVVFSPRPLLTDVAIADGALLTCVEQAIVDQKVSQPNELTTLNCSHAGISDLQGLEVFTGLQQLKLSSNEIRNLASLMPMSSLSALYLDDNQVVDPVPLYDLLSLRILDLSGNTELQCPGRNALFRLEELKLPDHCRQP